MPSEYAQLQPFEIRTCEEVSVGEAGCVLEPPTDDWTDPFLVQDPFGLRKAVVPIFHRFPTGDLVGLGSGFVADPFGTVITADHVIDKIGNRHAASPEPDSQNGELMTFELNEGEALVALLGVGLAYGQVPIPEHGWLVGSRLFTPAVLGNDPMRKLRGELDVRPWDFCRIDPHVQPCPGILRILPIMVSPWRPQRDDWVVALGYPTIRTEGTGETDPIRISEEMHAAYGRIVNVHPNGTGTFGGPQTPVIEVACRWPSGMSGGPVINQNGEVVGIVSRSDYPESALGHGFATAIPLLNIDEWLPSLDRSNPCMRRGWLEINESDDAIAIHRTEAEARSAAMANRGHTIRFGSLRIGTQEWCS